MKCLSLSLILLSAIISVTGQASTFHTNPACWEQSRIYHSGPPTDDILGQVNVVQVPKTAVPDIEPVISPNSAYQFWVRQPDTTRPGPWSAGVIIDTERNTRTALLFENVIQAPNPRWITEKLIYMRMLWGRVVYSDIIFDVEDSEIIYHEQANDGQIAFAQFLQACDGPCPCESADEQAGTGAPTASTPVVEEPGPVAGQPVAVGSKPGQMPAATPAEDEMIGLLILPTIFGPPQTGGIVPAENPVPVPVYDAPKAGAIKIAEPERPEDFVYKEYTYEGAAAIVYRELPGWYETALRGDTDDSARRVWISAKSAGEYMPVGELLLHRQSYLNEHWDGYLWQGPTTYMRYGQSKLKAKRDPRQREEYPVRILDSQKVGDGLWLQIETLKGTACAGGGEGLVADRGWIPAYSAEGKLVAGFHSRGC